MWLSSFLLFIGLAATSLQSSAVNAEANNKPKDPFAARNSPREELRKKIFADSLNEPQCKVIIRRLSDELTSVDASVKDIVDTVLKSLRNKDAATLRPLFHPRLKISATKSEEIFATLGASVLEPWDFSIYRMWAMNTPEGRPVDLDCAQDELKLTPHTGYPLQFGLWLQVMGRNELARIYATIVPDPKGIWRIGAWHIQQWTHLGKDPDAWTQLAIADSKANLNLPAYLKFDIAAKLVNSSYFIKSKLQQRIAEAMSQYGNKNQLLAEMQKRYKDVNIIYVDSVLAEDGVGMLFRIVVKGDESAVQMADMCRKLGKEFYADPVNRQNLGGIRCSYAYPGEPPLREGKLGGRFFPKKEFL